MARTSTAVLLVLTYVGAVYCSLDKESMYQELKNDMFRLVNSENPTIKLVTTGSVGVGKSTLINALVGMGVAKTGYDVKSVTREVREIMVVKNGIHVHITDTPGLGDADLEDDDTLHKVLEHSEHIDLFLFCLKMIDRLDRYHIERIKAVTDIFGGDIWKKGLFVLTFANGINKEHFHITLYEWEKEIRKRLTTIIDPEVAKNIPIVPTGFREPDLPDRPSWVSEFWVQGFRKMGFKGMLYLIQLNKDRIHGAMDGMKLSEYMYRNPEDQPLITCNMSRNISEKFIDRNHFSGLNGSLVDSSAGMGSASLPMSTLTGDACVGIATALYESFGWSIEETEVDCYEEALGHSLFAAFLEEYPDYLIP